MRTTWNGSLSFGLVSIPVGLAPATKPAARSSDISFRMLHRECGTPIKQKRYCPVHERDLGPDEIVKGWEVSKGQFVLVEDEELVRLFAAKVLTRQGYRVHTMPSPATAIEFAMALPLVVFFSLQKYFVRGLTAGSVKG